MKELKMNPKYMQRNLNVGFSGGEKKKNEVLQIKLLMPKFIILDEIDSGLDVDALKVVSNFINEYYKTFKPTILIITHHTNIIKYIKPNYVHILDNGKIVKTGDYHLAENIENIGFNEAFTISEEGKDE